MIPVVNRTALSSNCVRQLYLSHMQWVVEIKNIHLMMNLLILCDSHTYEITNTLQQSLSTDRRLCFFPSTAGVSFKFGLFVFFVRNRVKTAGEQNMMTSPYFVCVLCA